MILRPFSVALCPEESHVKAGHYDFRLILSSLRALCPETLSCEDGTL